MFKNSPKLGLKVSLLDNNLLDIEIILIQSHFKHFLEYATIYTIKDNYMVCKNMTKFSININSKIINIPYDLKTLQEENKKVSLKFNSNKERYDFLKSFSRSLLEWSNSKIWINYNDPNKIKIIYKSKIWLIY